MGNGYQVEPDEYWAEPSKMISLEELAEQIGMEGPVVLKHLRKTGIQIYASDGSKKRNDNTKKMERCHWQIDHPKRVEAFKPWFSQMWRYRYSEKHLCYISADQAPPGVKPLPDKSPLTGEKGECPNCAKLEAEIKELKAKLIQKQSDKAAKARETADQGTKERWAGYLYTCVVTALTLKSKWEDKTGNEPWAKKGFTNPVIEKNIDGKVAREAIKAMKRALDDSGIGIRTEPGA